MTTGLRFSDLEGRIFVAATKSAAWVGTYLLSR
jgi:hypothetical protein